MRLTAIDIGTNTILMLIADVAANGRLDTVRDEQVIARLGKGVDAHRRITPETAKRVLEYLRGYRSIAADFRTDKMIVCGTSALRDSANTSEFIQFIRDELDLEIEILSGQEEAELTYRGAVSEFLEPGHQQPFAVLDIGGGSTELTFGTGESVTASSSIDLGSVRLTERILQSSPPSTPALNQALSEVRMWISTFPAPRPHHRLIGVAGTATTLAAVDLQLGTFDASRVSGRSLSAPAVERIFGQLRSLTVEEIVQSYPQIQSGRADILLAGTMILKEAMKKFAVDSITVSARGLRYGMVLREVSREGNKREKG
jgi:exopolyphosphatase/guanosine-5'-triphosphate,3'-diphosphate pyrophosphatase